MCVCVREICAFVQNSHLRHSQQHRTFTPHGIRENHDPFNLQPLGQLLFSIILTIFELTIRRTGKVQETTNIHGNLKQQQNMHEDMIVNRNLINDLFLAVRIECLREQRQEKKIGQFSSLYFSVSTFSLRHPQSVGRSRAKMFRFTHNLCFVRHSIHVLFAIGLHTRVLEKMHTSAD